MVLLLVEHLEEIKGQFGVGVRRAKLLCPIEEKALDVLKQWGGQGAEKGKEEKES